jgi:hypothetical protein
MRYAWDLDGILGDHSDRADQTSQQPGEFGFCEIITLLTPLYFAAL